MNKIIKTVTIITIILFINATISAQNIKHKSSIKNKQETNVNNSYNELLNKVITFQASTESFLNTIKSQSGDKFDDNEKESILSAVSSMIGDNKNLQELTKKELQEHANDNTKSHLIRELLPNLQNINRQLTRMQDSLKSSSINLRTFSMQAERIDQSIKQVADRMKNNAQ